jgi:RNA polymerase primary sigma factor
MSKRHIDNAELDTIDEYLARIKKIPLLSAKEESDLAAAIKKGDLAARDKLVNANLRLAVKAAYAYMNIDLSLMDLIQEGNLGLIHAAEKFDGKRNARFATYANWWIKQSISRFIESKRRAIKLPIRKEQTLKQINYIYNYLSQKLARAPTDAEIAREVGVTAEEVRHILDMTGEIVTFESDIATNDMLSVNNEHEVYTYSPETALMREEVRAAARDFLSRRLAEKEKAVVMYRFQFDETKEPLTFQKIGEKIGVSTEAVRQIEIRALRKLKSNAQEYAECLYA